MSWKIIGPIAAIVSLSLSGCAAETIVRTPPPPDREEVPSAAPSGDQFWVRGNWRWTGEQHVWTPGHWEARRRDAIWAPGHWRATTGGWMWVEGRWAERG